MHSHHLTLELRLDIKSSVIILFDVCSFLGFALGYGGVTLCGGSISLSITGILLGRIGASLGFTCLLNSLGSSLSCFLASFSGLFTSTFDCLLSFFNSLLYGLFDAGGFKSIS